MCRRVCCEPDHMLFKPQVAPTTHLPFADLWILLSVLLLGELKLKTYPFKKYLDEKRTKFDQIL